MKWSAHWFNRARAQTHSVAVEELPNDIHVDENIVEDESYTEKRIHWHLIEKM